MSHKYQVGQLVKIIVAKNHPDMLGQVGCIIAQPNTVEYVNKSVKTVKDTYTVEVPGCFGPGLFKCPHCMWATYEEEIAPVDDQDNRTKAEKDELVFKGLMLF